MNFISFSCLIALSRTSSTILNRSHRSGQPFQLSPFQFFSIDYNVSSEFIIYGLYYVKVCSFYTHSVKVFIMKECCILWNAYSASIEMIMWFLAFSLLMWWITFIHLPMLNPPCIPVINPTWSWCVTLFNIFLILFSNILLRIFTSIFIRDFGLYASIFLSCDILVWFCYQGNAGVVEWVWKDSLFLSILEEFEEDWYKFFFTCLVGFIGKVV